MPNLGRPFRFLLGMLATALVILAVFCALPQNRYLRFLSLTDPAVVKSGWIYARVHFDPTPIDIVFIGTSHTVFGVNSMEVERNCREAGGEHCHTVNFALQHLGRNVHWLLAREVLENRKPRTIVIEVQERETRAMHPAFAYLADASDILTAPLVINTSFFPDLARLPLRQLSLFAKTEAPALFGVRTTFDPVLYRGPHWDDTYAERGSRENPILDPVPRTRIHTMAELEYERRHPHAGKRASLHLPGHLRALEYRASLIYLDKILALARQKGVSVRFLYLPSFRGQKNPQFNDLYRKAGPVWHIPDQLLNRHKFWLDVEHFNSTGADAVSAWLGHRIAAAESKKREPRRPF